MARPRKNWAVQADVQPESSDEAPSMAAGLEVTEPAPVEPEVVAEPEMVAEEPEVEAVNPEPVGATEATIGNSIVMVGQLYNKAGDVSVDLSKHLRTTASEPELHSFLSRIQTILGEFRHAVDQTEVVLSEELRKAIAEAVAA